MTIVRRGLLVLVGLLLLLDVGALALVKFSSGPEPSDEKSKVVIWIDSEEQANAASEMLKEKGYEPLVKADKRDEMVEADFRVVMEASRKELLDPVAEVLKKGGHKSLSFSKDGTTLYYGSVYPTKAKAQSVAANLKEKELLVFDVKPGQKTVKKPSYRVILLEVPSNMVSEVTGPIQTEFTVANIEETELAPAPTESESAEAESSEG